MLRAALKHDFIRVRHVVDCCTTYHAACGIETATTRRILARRTGVTTLMPYTVFSIDAFVASFAQELRKGVHEDSCPSLGTVARS